MYLWRDNIFNYHRAAKATVFAEEADVFPGGNVPLHKFPPPSYLTRIFPFIFNYNFLGYFTVSLAFLLLEILDIVEWCNGNEIHV